MSALSPINQTSFTDLELVRRGKVRDVYAVDDERLLVVATDRISAFDCILPTQIERKGEVLTALSRFWFARLAHVTPHHLITTDIEQMPAQVRRHTDALRGRAMLVRRTEVSPVECVVRGYLAPRTRRGRPLCGGRASRDHAARPYGGAPVRASARCRS